MGKVKKTAPNRDFIWDEDTVRQIQLMGGLGCTEKEICLVLDISRRTLIRNKEKHAELLAHMEKGKGMVKTSLSKTLFDKARAGNIAAAIWLEKSRFGYRETKQHDVYMQGPRNKGEAQKMVVEELAELCFSPDERIRDFAKIKLAQIADDKVEPITIEMEKDDDED